jgi:hypothetical protein
VGSAVDLYKVESDGSYTLLKSQNLIDDRYDDYDSRQSL